MGNFDLDGMASDKAAMAGCVGCVGTVMLIAAFVGALLV